MTTLGAARMLAAIWFNSAPPLPAGLFFVALEICLDHLGLSKHTPGGLMLDWFEKHQGFADEVNR